MLRISTWNIGEDESNINNIVNKESYEYIKDLLLKNKIDIICFQESIVSSNNIDSISKYMKENTYLKYSADLKLSISNNNINNIIGVSICSRFPIEKTESIMFENPNLIYNNKISQDKGFIFAHIKSIPLIICSGHCFPFRAFNKKHEEYKYIFEDMEKKMLNLLNNNFIVAGDMNYDNVSLLFPNIINLTNQAKLKNTYKNTQIDHILVSKNINILYNNVLRTRFDHNLCICDLDI